MRFMVMLMMEHAGMLYVQGELHRWRSGLVSRRRLLQALSDPELEGDQAG
jgi:hypothetical protein